MRVTVKIETRYASGQLLWPELIRIVYWCGKDELGLEVVSIREITDKELDPADLESWERTRAKRYALVEFEVPEGLAFDAKTLRDPENDEGRGVGVIVTVV